MIVIVVVGLLDLQLALFPSQRVHSLQDHFLQRHALGLVQAKDEAPGSDAEESSEEPAVDADRF